MNALRGAGHCRWGFTPPGESGFTRRHAGSSCLSLLVLQGWRRRHFTPPVPWSPGRLRLLMSAGTALGPEFPVSAIKPWTGHSIKGLIR